MAAGVSCRLRATKARARRARTRHRGCTRIPPDNNDPAGRARRRHLEPVPGKRSLVAEADDQLQRPAQRGNEPVQHVLGGHHRARSATPAPPTRPSWWRPAPASARAACESPPAAALAHHPALPRPRHQTAPARPRSPCPRPVTALLTSAAVWLSAAAHSALRGRWHQGRGRPFLAAAFSNC